MANSFVLYETVRQTHERIKKFFGVEAANHFMEVIMDYGFDGVLPPEDDVVWAQGGLDHVFYSIQTAKDRYAAAVENGKKGGRPPKIDKEKVMELKNQGLSNAKIAEMIGCHPSSISKIVKNLNNLNENRDFSLIVKNENDDGNGFFTLPREKLGATAAVKPEERSFYF